MHNLNFTDFTTIKVQIITTYRIPLQLAQTEALLLGETGVLEDNSSVRRREHKPFQVPPPGFGPQTVLVVDQSVKLKRHSKALKLYCYFG